MGFYRNTGIRRGSVYGVRSGRFIKIGWAGDVEERMETMKLYNPHPLELVFCRRTASVLHFERKMHEVLAPYAVGREWFRVTVDQIRAAASNADVHVAEAVKRAKEADRDRKRKMLEARAKYIVPLGEHWLDGPPGRFRRTAARRTG